MNINNRVSKVKVHECLYSVSVQLKNGQTEVVAISAASEMKVISKCMNLGLNVLKVVKLSDISYTIL